MAGENTLATLNGLYKEVYANKIEDLIPANVKFTPMVPFISAEKQLGNQYHQPVILADEHGHTFSGGTTGDAFDLESAVAGQTKDATVSGAEILKRGRLGYGAASRATGGKNAFVDATSLLVKNLRRSIAKTLEVELLYGQSGIAVVDSVATNTITITDATWAPGIWSGAENLRVQALDGATVQNTSGGVTLQNGVVGGGANAANAMVVASVDIANKAITVDDATGVDAGDVIFYAGAKGREMAGLHTITANTGTLFGIDASAYNLWAGNSYSVGGSLSWIKALDAIDLAVGKGLDSDVTLLVSAKTWTDTLGDDLAAQRRVDSSYSTSNIDQGSQGITFYGQTGKITVVPSIFVWEGYSYVFNTAEMVRVGSTDVTFRNPGDTENFFMYLENSAGFELRAYTDQALFCHAPGRTVQLTGIDNS